MYQFAAMQLTTVAVHDGGPREADWIRWAGILLAFSGTLAAAPVGVVRLLRSPRAAAELFWEWLRKVTGLERFSAGWTDLYTDVLKVLFQGAAQLMPPQDDAWKTGMDKSGATIQVHWNENDRLKVKVERPHDQIRIVRLAGDSRHVKLRADLGQMRAATAALTKRMDSADLGAAKSASRGVILIGVGVILTGVPDGLARVVWPAGGPR